ncbi:hypothetical protein ACHAXR_011864 [Thalassiosira sp. AJA248-18]
MLPNPPTSSPTNSAREADFWYPMYETAWDQSGCSNKLPLPYNNINDRPRYDTGELCCASAYSGQFSKACVDSLARAITHTPTTATVTISSTLPTNSPTNSPSNSPTNSPSNSPTNSPSSSPTDQPSKSPSHPPTLSPSKSPTNAPTQQPTTSPTIQVVDCPVVGDPMAIVSSGFKSVPVAADNAFCGIFLRKQSGDLIPLARSYNGQNWEPAPGPLASPADDVNATNILLPDPQDPSDEYVILSKNGTMGNRTQLEIAKFLELATFGPKKSEIDALEGSWGAAKRAQYVRAQMDLPATSHREYWRKRTNSKWDATAMPARSDHPCSPNSKWRKYSYIRQDRFNTITGQYIYTQYETVPEEANLVYTIYEADRDNDVNSHGSGSFRSDNPGFSGIGYYDMQRTDDYVEFEVVMAEGGTYPISFRFAMGSSAYNGNWPCQLWVNDVMIAGVYDFVFTDSWRYWMYSDLVDVQLNSGSNTIKLIAVDQSDGPNVDHLRVGKPPAMVLKTNGWPRAIAKNGIHCLESWPCQFTNETNTTFTYYPEPPMGDLYLYNIGYFRVDLNGTNTFLDIGNPTIDFTGYEQVLPPDVNVFTFAENDTFVNTSSDLFSYPIREGQEMLLTNGFSGPVCDNVPPFAEENDAPIFGILPSGEWIQWSPTILLEDNGPSVNAAQNDMTTSVLSDGGGELFVQTNEHLKCSNVPRSFINKDTCFLSTESTACSATDPVGEVVILLSTSNVLEFYKLDEKYVYAIRGLVMEDISEHACQKTVSRWTFELNTTCSAPTELETGTNAALETAISASTDANEFVKDVSRTLACDSTDETTSKINIQIQVGSDCYTHVHPDHLNVYDFSGWVLNHPGGAYNIQKWAEGWEDNEGCDLKTDAIAQKFGATPPSVIDGGVIVCGSIGEVGNNPTLGETFDIRSNEHTTSSSDLHNNQKQVAWTEIALYEQDQLRQRMAWALAQIVTTVPINIDAYDRTEIYTNYYDILVKHAFGNYRDILAEASYSPLMAEHLSYLRSKSHSYVYEDEDKRISRADENYAREIMQLFSIGLVKLNDDGTPVIDPATGNPLETYTNENIESFARAWTGFDRIAARGNYEESRTGTSDNRLDPMRIIPDWRDPFPKSHLNQGFIGDGYLLCKDLPAQSFLKKGAGYRLLGGKSSPELMKDPSHFADDSINDILRVELSPSSALYERLHNGGNYEVFVELESDLICTPGTFECDVDTLRVVKLGSVYYEFVERPCVQLAFFDNGKQINFRDWRQAQMCANTDLAHAREACCREDRSQEVQRAKMESNVTYLYEGERMTWATARNRCVAYGKDLCLHNSASIDWWRKGYHWTNRDCGINVKVNSEGYIAIVHDAMITYEDSIPWLVEEENTLNWFRVFWNGGSYPGDSEANTCAVNNCRSLTDGSCLCKTTVTESVVFADINSVSKDDVMSQLFIGALAPQDGDGSTETVLGNGVTVHVVGGNVDTSTVFQIEDKGRTIFLKNTLSTVSLAGWATTPQIYEAEDATINNANIKNNTKSATGGFYVEGFYGNETTFIEWTVDVDAAGPYLISLRYANHYTPRPLNVFVNTQEVLNPPANPNPVLPFNSIDNQGPEHLPLQRCDGRCSSYDDHCGDGLYCIEPNHYEAVPGCNGTKLHWYGYCVDVNDFDNGFTLLPTGGWTDDWHYSEPLEVNLNAGQNSIRVQLPPDYIRGPNIDHLKVEGLPTSTSLSSFRNPPHFMSLIPDNHPGGLGERNLRDAQYETDAVLDHYFFQDNVAPFMCVRIMQRFSFSNPSPRFVSSCVDAFRTGLYTSASETFGSGKYGSLEAMAASIILDREATEVAISSDPSYGSIKEPMLKVTNLMRSMEYQTSIPTNLEGAPLQTNYHTKLWEIDEKIGHGPYEFPTVFSYMLPEYVPDSGPNLAAKLVSPESALVTMPNVVALLNGMFSMIKYGLSDCHNGFSTYPGYGNCNDDGQYQRSFGHLFYEPSGADDYENAADLALLLTAGRLSQDNINIIVDACSSEPDQPSKTRCMQQLIVTTGEFHSTNTVTQSGEDRITDTGGETSTEEYKAIVYFYLAGGLDSYNMLAPHTCSPIDVYERYRISRGKSEAAGGVGLLLLEMLEIPANNLAQPCTSFGIHQKLPQLKELYDLGKLNFIANAGLLAKPVTVDDYNGETPVQLFAHNAMTLEAKRDDLYNEFGGTGVGGRLADVLTQAGIPSNSFSIDGQQALLTGEAGQGPSQFIVSSSGLSEFNRDPTISNMNEIINTLNNSTTNDSGFHAETWSSKLTQSLAKQALLKQEVDATSVTTIFPSSRTADQFEMITRIMQTREARGSKRDIFYTEDGGYDTHADVYENLNDNFDQINAALAAFVDELENLDLWGNTVVVQFSEFARTLDPNTGNGTDHAWGGHHFMFGGAVKGGQVLGQYPSDFEEGDAEGIALSRGRMIPTAPWDAMWKPLAEWFGVNATGPDMDKVLPMHKNFPQELLYNETDVFSSN